MTVALDTFDMHAGGFLNTEACWECMMLFSCVIGEDYKLMPVTFVGKISLFENAVVTVGLKKLSSQNLV